MRNSFVKTVKVWIQAKYLGDDESPACACLKKQIVICLLSLAPTAEIKMRFLGKKKHLWTEVQSFTSEQRARAPSSPIHEAASLDEALLHVVSPQRSVNFKDKNAVAVKWFQMLF